MCQICTQTRSIAGRDRWPKPLEPQIQEYLALMPSTHAEVTTFLDRPKPTATSANPSSSTVSTTTTSSGSSTQTLVETKQATPQNNSPPLSLLETLSLLNLQLQLLSTAREDWWDSPTKKKQRREWQEACDQKKLTGLQVVNHKTGDMIADLEALLGRFVRWTLGVEEGLDGLDGAIDVAKRGGEKRNGE